MVIAGRSSESPRHSGYSLSTSPTRPPAVKRHTLRSGTSSCAAGMAPSIRSCCVLSEHWSRNLLGPKEPGRGAGNEEGEMGGHPEKPKPPGNPPDRDRPD